MAKMKELWVESQQGSIDEIAEQELRMLLESDSASVASIQESAEIVQALSEINSSNKGVKHDDNKAPLHMIPEVALTGAAEAFAFGAKKYARFNYRKGIEYCRLTDSLRRHTLAFLRGEDIDPDSGLHHTKLILANAAMLEFMRVNKPEMDDRWTTEPAKNENS